MKALHFGAGNIGCGFIGQLLADACIEVVFADVNQQVLDIINQYHQYTVLVVGEKVQVKTVNNVSAIHSNSDKIIALIADVSLITTAVGPQILEQIAPSIAKGLLNRYQNRNLQPLNIIACENIVRGTSKLKGYILKVLDKPYHSWVEKYIGFVDSAVDRIIPPTKVGGGDHLQVMVETFSEWIVDETQFKGQPPLIPGMQLTNNLMAFVERKLFTLNTGHAITAYLGQLKKHQTIREAIFDPTIRQIVNGAMEESGAVLINRYGFNIQKHTAYINKIIQRFENPYLHDNVERVGRQQLRKLSFGDRLIKPLRGTIDYGLDNTNLIKGIAAAMHYHSLDDPQAQEWAVLISKLGPQAALAKVSGLDKDSEIIEQIVSVYNTML